MQFVRFDKELCSKIIEELLQPCIVLFFVFIFVEFENICSRI